MSSPIALAPLAVSISSLPRTFHPTLTVQLDIPQSSQFVPGAQCQAILRLPLPDAVFVDPDELHGRWGPRGLLLNEQADVVTEGRASGTADVRRALGWALSPRDIDIERPVRPPHTPSRDGKGAPRRQDVASVLWLSVPIDAHDEGLDERECEGQTITVEIPLHGRYLVPNDAGSVNITLFDNAPSVQDATGALQAGWTCEHIALTPPLGKPNPSDPTRRMQDIINPSWNPNGPKPDTDTV